MIEMFDYSRKLLNLDSLPGIKVEDPIILFENGTALCIAWFRTVLYFFVLGILLTLIDLLCDKVNWWYMVLWFIYTSILSFLWFWGKYPILKYYIGINFANDSIILVLTFFNIKKIFKVIPRKDISYISIDTEYFYCGYGVCFLKSNGKKYTALIASKPYEEINDYAKLIAKTWNIPFLVCNKNCEIRYIKKDNGFSFCEMPIDKIRRIKSFLKILFIYLVPLISLIIFVGPITTSMKFLEKNPELRPWINNKVSWSKFWEEYSLTMVKKKFGFE